MKNIFVYEFKTRKFIGAFEGIKEAHKYVCSKVSKYSDLKNFNAFLEAHRFFDVDQLVYEVLEGKLETKEAQLGYSVNYFRASQDEKEAFNEIYALISHELELNIIKKVA